MWNENNMISHALLNSTKTVYSTANKFSKNYMKMKILKSEDTALIF